MKAIITERGVELFVESQTEAYALRYLFPVGATPEENGKKITFHSDPKSLHEYEKEMRK